MNANFGASTNEVTILTSSQDYPSFETADLTLEELVDEITDLVSLPEIYLRIRKLMDDRDSRLDDFAEVVSGDPSLTAAVLKIVNSAFFGFAGQIDNISRALNMIGIGQLHDLVLSISAVNSLDLPNEIIDMQDFWRRSIFCGVLSRLLAEDIHIKDSDSFFVIGLLHEIGHLILFLKFPGESQQAIQKSEQQATPLYRVERDIFGFDYGQLGQELMKAWNLPIKFQSITGFHTQPSTAQDFSLETFIVHIAHIHSIAPDTEDAEEKFNWIQQQMDPQALEVTKMTPEKIKQIVIATDEISAAMEKMILG